MGRDDWYRRTTWTAEDREEFFARLKRSRTTYNKTQYLTVQAWHLQSDASPPNYEAALELLDTLLTEFPDPSQLGSAYLQKAQCLEALGRIEQAADAFRDAVKAEGVHTGMRTTAPLDFAMFVVKHELRHLYNEVLENIGDLRDPEPLFLFPIAQYQALAAMAIIGSESGKKRQASEYAGKAIEAWNNHEAGELNPEGAQPNAHPHPEIHKKLLELASARNKKPWWKVW
jgi:tetratricopeptide (TPR) repeat protein